MDPEASPAGDHIGSISRRCHRDECHQVGPLRVAIDLPHHIYVMKLAQSESPLENAWPGFVILNVAYLMMNLHLTSLPPGMSEAVPRELIVGPQPGLV